MWIVSVRFICSIHRQACYLYWIELSFFHPPILLLIVVDVVNLSGFIYQVVDIETTFLSQVMFILMSHGKSSLIGSVMLQSLSEPVDSVDSSRSVTALTMKINHIAVNMDWEKCSPDILLISLAFTLHLPHQHLEEPERGGCPLEQMC